jgi:hypothetical protein
VAQALGEEDDPVAQTKDAVEKADKTLGVVATLTSDPEKLAKINALREALKGAGDLLGYYVKGKKIWDFIQACRAMAATDPQKDSKAFAKAAGELFATAGDLGETFIPIGTPGRAYFTLLKSSRNFFSDMERLLVPESRWPQLKQIMQEP